MLEKSERHINFRNIFNPGYYKMMMMRRRRRWKGRGEKVRSLIISLLLIYTLTRQSLNAS
jgi:hypothetical protein